MRKIRARKLKLGFLAVGCAHTLLRTLVPRGGLVHPCETESSFRPQTPHPRASFVLLLCGVGLKAENNVWCLGVIVSCSPRLLPLNGIRNSFLTHRLHHHHHHHPRPSVRRIHIATFTSHSIPSTPPSSSQPGRSPSATNSQPRLRETQSFAIPLNLAHLHSRTDTQTVNADTCIP